MIIGIIYMYNLVCCIFGDRIQSMHVMDQSTHITFVIVKTMHIHLIETN